MTVGILQLELYLPGVSSLKEKRTILRKIESRIRNKHNVSVAEVGYQDKWARSLLAFVNVSNSSNNTVRLLQSIESFIEINFPVQVLGQNLEVL